MYCDDSGFTIVSVPTLLHSLQAWHTVTTGCGWIMASQDKRSIGLSMLSLGAELYFNVGVIETNTPYLAPLFPSKSNAPSEAPPSDHQYSNNHA